MHSVKIVKNIILPLMLLLCILFYNQSKNSIVKPVFSGHSKINKTKILMTNGSLTVNYVYETFACQEGFITQRSS